MATSKFTKYRQVVEKLGAKQLDVYRYKDREILRVMKLRDRKIILVELPKKRDDLSLDEFEKTVREALGK